MIRVVVGCHAGSGPELFPVKVDCTKTEIENGEHYEAAIGIIQENYEVSGPFWACDEHDPANSPKALALRIFDLFTWEQADLTSC